MRFAERKPPRKRREKTRTPTNQARSAHGRNASSRFSTEVGNRASAERGTISTPRERAVAVADPGEASPAGTACGAPRRASDHAVATGRASISARAAQETAYRSAGVLRASTRRSAASAAATSAPCQRKWKSAHPSAPKNPPEKRGAAVILSLLRSRR